MNISEKYRRYLSLSLIPRLISPLSWWHCFNLLYNPLCFQLNPSLSLLKTSFRLSINSLKYILIHIIVLILIGLWCYLYWLITFDAGQYWTLLSSISSNQTDVNEGRQRFNQLFWRTSLTTLFISIDFGMINTCAVLLSAHWRERITKQFYRILFQSPHGSILYETGQQSHYDLPSQLTNDIRQLTSNISIGLFGSLYFSGLIAVSTVVVVFSIYIVEQTNGDRNGIGICFLTFGICVSWILLISRKFNRTIVEQLKSKGKLRSYLQYLQTFAECLAFYATTKQCELKTFFKLNQIVHHWNNRAAFYYFFVTFPLIIMDVIGSLITYILPAFLFFFLRQSSQQSREEATKYLGIISFYGYVFWLLNALVYINESMLIALNLADRLWVLKNNLLNLQKSHQHRFEHEKIKSETPDLIELIHLKILVPDTDGERTLQSNINLNARRGECVLITGTTGCGKSSLFRICAGLWTIHAQSMKFPSRKQTIFIPQRPYLPIGSLRFQTLFLLNLRSEFQWNDRINEQQIRDLFHLVRMDYLLDRYHLDSIIEWSTQLSIGEQQRLAFIRLFALYKYHPDEICKTLLMLDESTSAVDMFTESLIYQLLKEFRVWFVTISHRPSLIKYHQKQLKLFSNIRDSCEDTLDIHEEEDQNVNEEIHFTPLSMNNQIIGYVNTQSSNHWFKQLKDLWKLIHLPFGPNDLQLRLQTYISWLMCLIVLGCYTYITYRRTIQTGDIFRVMPNYASGQIDLLHGRKEIVGLIWSYLLYLFGLTFFYTIQLSIGQYLSSLYTRRQSNYIGRLLLEDDEYQYTLYNTARLKYLPGVISHDLADMNVQLFYLLIGSMYFNGMIGVLVKLIPYTLLLAQQSGSFKGVMIVYVYQLFTSLCIVFSVIPYHRTNIKSENAYSLLSNAQKRVDIQSEQIALSDRSVIDIEHNELELKLMDSIRTQKYSGYFYGLLTACSVFGNWSSTIINYGIPSLIFFYFASNPTQTEATSIITLTVYTSYLQSNLAGFNSHGQPFSQLWTIGRRIAQNLEELMEIRETHRQLRLKEFSSGRRIEIHPSDYSLIVKNVDVTIPSSPSNILIRSLSFSLHRSSSLIITGSSGCGKSSLLRLLAGLQYNLNEHSSIELPSRSSMIFISQQVYLIEGTLREQLNYFRQSRQMSIYSNDQILEDLLAKFHLLHLVQRYTFDSSRQLWSRTLSMGEQQRLIMIVALLTLFPPVDSDRAVKFFVLDETTSGCDQRTEEMIYRYLNETNIQFISISHRQQLIQYHTHQLIINPNDQSYQFLQLAKTSFS